MRVLLAVFALLALALVACSDDDTGNGGDSAVCPARESGETWTTDGGVEVTQRLNGEELDPAQTGDALAVHYTGMLSDGTVFDTSLERDEPFTFVLGRGNVIQGWEEGIACMSPGDERRLIIPASLAYGERGFGDVIPPRATLTFDVELVAFGRLATPTAEATG